MYERSELSSFAINATLRNSNSNAAIKYLTSLSIYLSCKDALGGKKSSFHIVALNINVIRGFMHNLVKGEAACI